MSLRGKVFLGEALNAVGMTAEASDQFQKIVDTHKTDKRSDAESKDAIFRVRTQLLTVLREREKFDEAMKEAEGLIKENPRALEPLVKKAEILEAWAEKNPAKYADAVAQWVVVRNRLQPLAAKPDYAEAYYDAVYNAAKCLVREAEKSKDKKDAAERANEAEKVLKAALILTPKLNGPTTVEKFKALRDKAIELQGRSPEAKGAKQDEKKP